MATATAPQTEAGVVLTEAAAAKIRTILDEKGLAETHALRVFVQGGGCGGMQYGMTFEDNPREDDEIYDQFEIRIIVDPTSLFYLNGAHIDWVDSPMGGGFNIENPNAVSSCGCGSGSSFRTAKSHTGEEMPESCH
ncbi:MAG: iron-sulfur cluster assembly accessory protein [Chloroflexi bacterium]|nr:iron-sulfur cluster assembly accessory protein [Chloroflexota bacterium]